MLFSPLRCVLLAASLFLSSVTAQNATFTRASLEATLDKYLNALVTHDPTKLTTSPSVTYVENSQFLKLGTGLWSIASSLGKYRHVFSDPVSQQVAAITTLKENDTPIIYVVRLKLANDGSINEIETQITRDATGAGRYENMTKPEDVWLQAVPSENRVSRAKLIEVTNKYYTGMERNDPRGNYSFFDKDCNRLEDGLQTTNQKNGDPYGHSNDTAFASLGCEAQFQTGFLGFVTKIRDRRYPVVDEERQAVLAITIFDHNGTVRELPSVNGTSNPIPPYFDVPRTLAASEAFRLKGEKLYRIEMTLTEVPYGMRTAFDVGSTIDLRGAGNNFTIPTPYTRASLESLLGDVMQALLNNQPLSLPLAKGARYSENGQYLALGDGLWETLNHYSRPGADSYVTLYTVEGSGAALYYGAIEEQTTPGVLALRVQLTQGKISEIEAIAVRAEAAGERGGTKTLMRPPLPIEWQGDSVGTLDQTFKGGNYSGPGFFTNVLAMYLDGWEIHSSSRVDFTQNCTRRDNGVQTTTSCGDQMWGLGKTPNGLFNAPFLVRDRRTLIIDSQRGVIASAVMVDYAADGAGPLSAEQSIPSTYMVLQLMKNEGELISKVESWIKWMPFGFTSAWGEVNRSGVKNKVTLA